MKMAVIWIIAPCRVVRVYQRFRGLYCLYHIGLMMEAVQTSETLVNLYQSTWHYNPDDSHLRERNVLQGRTITQGHREFNIETHLAFMDYKKAFYRINRNKLMRILTENIIHNQLMKYKELPEYIELINTT
jgi:hypothetical protein